MKRRSLLVAFLMLPTLLFSHTGLKRANMRHRIRKGWHDMWQSFNYYDYDSADEMGFGVLRILDDFTMHNLDGTPIHPHKNMEILTIILEGQLFHQDSLGNSGIIGVGDLQLMSAGSGLKHAEVNPSRFEKAKGLQIWISPKVRNTVPRYQQAFFPMHYFSNRLAPILSDGVDENAFVMQQTGKLLRSISLQDKIYTYQKSVQAHGLYIFIISGEVNVAGNQLLARDGLGLEKENIITIDAKKGSDFLLFELPMVGTF